jgi:hypothetical protein
MAPLGDEDTFDVLAVVETKKIFLGAISRGLNLFKVEPADNELIRKGSAQVLREVGHFRKRMDTSLVNPSEDLAGSIRGYAALVQPLYECAFCEILYVFGISHGGLDGRFPAFRAFGNYP